jgi:hypothetical protein
MMSEEYGVVVSAPYNGSTISFSSPSSGGGGGSYHYTPVFDVSANTSYGDVNSPAYQTAEYFDIVNNEENIDSVLTSIDNIIDLKNPDSFGPLDAPIQPQTFPSFFSILKKMGISSLKYASRFISKKDSTELFSEYKFKIPKKEDYPNVVDFFDKFREEFVQMIDILNDFNPIKTDVNIPWDCEDSKICEIVQLGIETVLDKKISKLLVDNNTIESSHVDISANSDSVLFTNSSNIIVDNLSNGDTVLYSEQNIPIDFKPIEQLPISISNDLKVKGDDYNLAITNSELVVTSSKNSFNSAVSATARASSKYQSVYDRQGRGYSDYDNYKKDVRTEQRKYQAAKKIEVARWEVYARAINLDNGLKERKLRDVTKLLNKLVKDTCMNADDIKKTINDAYGSVLSLGSELNIQKSIYENKIPTKCCLQVCCNPCKYKLEV